MSGNCRICHSVLRPASKRWWDWALLPLGFFPVRCLLCLTRTYRNKFLPSGREAVANYLAYQAEMDESEEVTNASDKHSSAT
jgi:hypothetical protein